MTNCPRCGGSLAVCTVSKFNTETIACSAMKTNGNNRRLVDKYGSACVRAYGWF
jgi:hypothetical protein